MSCISNYSSHSRRSGRSQVYHSARPATADGTSSCSSPSGTSAEAGLPFGASDDSGWHQQLQLAPGALAEAGLPIRRAGDNGRHEQLQHAILLLRTKPCFPFGASGDRGRHEQLQLAILLLRTKPGFSFARPATAACTSNYSSHSWRSGRSLTIRHVRRQWPARAAHAPVALVEAGLSFGVSGDSVRRQQLQLALPALWPKPRFPFCAFGAWKLTGLIFSSTNHECSGWVAIGNLDSRGCTGDQKAVFVVLVLAEAWMGHERIPVTAAGYSGPEVVLLIDPAAPGAASGILEAAVIAQQTSRW